MKTKIIISGQIAGNNKLRNAIITTECEEKRGMFNSIILEFPTKKAAAKSLSQAFQLLRKGEPRQTGRIGGIRYSPKNALYYDASKAVIEPTN